MVYGLFQCSQKAAPVLPDGSVVKNPPANAEDTGLIPYPGRSYMLCTTIEPVLQRPGTAALKPYPTNTEAHVPQSQFTTREATAMSRPASQLKSSTHLLQLEKSPHSNKDPAQSKIAQLVQNPPAVQETPVQLLGREDSPAEGIGYSPQYSWAPVFWPGEFHALYSPWDLKELDTTERLSLSLSFKKRKRKAAVI